MERLVRKIKAVEQILGRRTLDQTLFKVYCCLFVVLQIPVRFFHNRVKDSVFSLLVSSCAMEGADYGPAQIRDRPVCIPHTELFPSF